MLCLLSFPVKKNKSDLIDTSFPQCTRSGTNPYCTPSNTSSSLCKPVTPDLVALQM